MDYGINLQMTWKVLFLLLPKFSLNRHLIVSDSEKQLELIKWRMKDTSFTVTVVHDRYGYQYFLSPYSWSTVDMWLEELAQLALLLSLSVSGASPGATIRETLLLASYQPPLSLPTNWNSSLLTLYINQTSLSLALNQLNISLHIKHQTLTFPDWVVLSTHIDQDFFLVSLSSVQCRYWRRWWLFLSCVLLPALSLSLTGHWTESESCEVREYRLGWPLTTPSWSTHTTRSVSKVVIVCQVTRNFNALHHTYHLLY